MNKYFLLVGISIVIAVGIGSLLFLAERKPVDRFGGGSPTPSSVPAAPFDLPFGSNNAFLSDGEETDVWLKDLGVSWISDHLPRRTIEKQRGDYDFRRIDGLLREYGAETRANAWFIINVESKLQFGDGKEVPEIGRFVPSGPVSYEAYEEFLEALVPYVNSRIPGWKAKMWSVDNEHAALYLPAFCGARKRDKNPACARQAATVYAELVERSHRVIKRLDPDARIVFGGPASGSPPEDYDLYYKEALNALHAKHESGYFDYFDYHNFNMFQNYQANMQGEGIGYFRQLLADTGFAEKPIIIKAGGTHSGKDEISKSDRLHTLQTENQQSEHEFKRLVYHVANGIALILRDTGREDPSEHTTFVYHGLRYNGIPKTKACDQQKEQPCPDPGDGIKKLAYYSFKFLIEKLRGSDFERIKTHATGVPNVYLYEFRKEGKPIFVAWRDTFGTDVAGEKTVTLLLPDIGTDRVKITEAIPAFDGDFQTRERRLDEREYPRFFRSTITAVSAGNKVSVTLTKSPVYIEPLHE